jgi:hypothetical protein
MSPWGRDRARRERVAGAAAPVRQQPRRTTGAGASGFDGWNGRGEPTPTATQAANRDAGRGPQAGQDPLEAEP